MYLGRRGALKQPQCCRTLFGSKHRSLRHALRRRPQSLRTTRVVVHSYVETEAFMTRQSSSHAASQVPLRCVCTRHLSSSPSTPRLQFNVKLQVDSILGDRQPTLEDLKALWWTTRCLNESMRLYPQPPVLIRRALEDDIVGGYKVPAPLLPFPTRKDAMYLFYYRTVSQEGLLVVR